MVLSATLHAAPDSQQLYLQAYDAEQGAGDPRRAIALYEELLRTAPPDPAGLLWRARYRLAVCHRRIGELEKARLGLTNLLAEEKVDRDLAEQARRELIAIVGEQEKVRVKGLVLDGAGNPVPGAAVFAGEWAYEPLIVTDSNGAFTVERRIITDEVYGSRYIMIYASHPTRRESTVAVVPAGTGPNVTCSLTVTPEVVIAGQVRDGQGQPVSGASLGIKIFISAMERPTQVFVPFERIMIWPRPGGDGRFVLPSLPRGVQMSITAACPGYRLRAPYVSITGATSGFAGLIMDPTGAAGFGGTVTGPGGAIAPARIRVFSMAPELREIIAVRSGEDGRFEIAGLSEGRYMVRADPVAANYGWRAIAGIEAGTALRLDFALEAIRDPGETRLVSVGGVAPPVTAVSVNTTPLSLAAVSDEVVLIGFWDRWVAADPPQFLEEMQRRFKLRGLRVWCIHDHSGLSSELVAHMARNRLDYALAIDAYSADAAGTRNSLTMSRYGANNGDAVLVGRGGRVAFTGSVNGPAVVEALTRIVTATLGIGQDSSTGQDRVGSIASKPNFDTVRWIQGEITDIARHQYTVVHCSSAYFDTQIRRRFPGELAPVESIARYLGSNAVDFVWLLPAGDNSPAAEQLAKETGAGFRIGIDIGGTLYGTLGVTAEGMNVVIDRTGRIVTGELPDSRVWHALRMLIEEKK